MVEVGRIAEVWRYPVKSMAGQRVAAADVGELGLHADRTWAVRDLKKNATIGAKRLPGLLLCTARYAQSPPIDAGPGNAPEVVIGFPDGQEISSLDPEIHNALSSYVDRDVELRPLPPIDDRDQYRGTVATAADVRAMFGIEDGEPLPDLSVFPVKKLAELSRYVTPVGSYADAYPIHIITKQTLQTMTTFAPGSDFDARRFRPTLLVDAADAAQHPELEWCEGTLATPLAEFQPLLPTVRCVMPSHQQYELQQDRQITRAVAAHTRHCLGVYGTIPKTGRVREGDPINYRQPHRSVMETTATAGAVKLKRLLMKAGTAALSKFS